MGNGGIQERLSILGLFIYFDCRFNAFSLLLYKQFAREDVRSTVSSPFNEHYSFLKFALLEFCVMQFPMFP